MSPRCKFRQWVWACFFLCKLLKRQTQRVQTTSSYRHPDLGSLRFTSESDWFALEPWARVINPGLPADCQPISHGTPMSAGKKYPTPQIETNTHTSTHAHTLLWDQPLFLSSYTDPAVIMRHLPCIISLKSYSKIRRRKHGLHFIGKGSKAPQLTWQESDVVMS